MTEEKRRIIEKTYINSFAPVYTEDYRKEGREDKKLLAHKEIKPLGKEKSGKCYGVWPVNTRLIFAVCCFQEELKKARKEAKDALDEYMAAKEALKSGDFDLTDKGLRKILMAGVNCRKQDWIEASNNVKELKAQLYYAQLEYTRFNEWYKATNTRIKELENK